jgi:hypothetical protein
MIRLTVLATAVLAFALSGAAFRPPVTGATVNPQVSVTSAEGPAASSVTVAVQGDSGDATIGAFTIDLVYDPSVATAVECASEVGLCGPQVTGNTARVAGASLGGLHGQFQFMTVTFDLTGAPGAVTALDISLVEMTDMDYEDLVPQTEVTEGQIAVADGAAPLQGDADCDGEITSLDALGVLRHVAGIEQVACAGPADTDCDGDITALDSLAILRYVASLPVVTPGGCTPIGQPL